jgi:NDP-sugar pyrophosphorylase family protein
VILCAGLGKRLGTYSNQYQKTMLPLYGKPVLEYILNGLKYTGLDKIIMVVGYKKKQIINYFKDGTEWGVNVAYIEQKELNGTGAAMLLCESLLKNKHFFLTWGDIIVPYEIYKKVYTIHKNEKQDFILVTNYTEDTSQGAAVVCQDDYCLDIIEKPPQGTIDSKLNNSGIFILSTEIFQVLKKLKPSSRGEIELPQALSLGIHTKNWKIRVLKMKNNQFRADIGNLKIYEKLKENNNWIKKLLP